MLKKILGTAGVLLVISLGIAWYVFNDKFEDTAES
jgi:hypothetical protein